MREGTDVKVNLFFNWYENHDRQHEIDTCLNNNKKVFDRVLIIKGRPTFLQLFELSKAYPDDINCFCNSDIYFDSVSFLHTIKENECYALCRHDIKDGVPVFANRPDAQDAWIFRGVIKPIDANFTMGLWGCDNRLAYEIKRAGYSLKNPSLSIKIIHLHAIDDRNHKRDLYNTVPGPYFTLHPTQ